VSHFSDPKFILLLQILAVVGIPLMLWRYFRLGRFFPLAIIQIFAGIALGPSILGALWPGAYETLFGPKYLKEGIESLKSVTDTLPFTMQQLSALSLRSGIETIAQIAVILFVFLAGCEADKQVLGNSAKMVLRIGVTGVFLPLVLGATAAWYLAGLPRAAGASIGMLPYGQLLYSIAFGLCMAVTALPILVIVLRELGFNQKPIGTVALAVGGVDDALLWGSLAILLPLAPSMAAVAGGVVTGNPWQSAIDFSLAIGGGVAAASIIYYLITPLLEKLLKSEAPERLLMSTVIIALFFASAITEFTGLHAVFGAFLVGLMLPEKLRHLAQDRFDVPVSLLLLPFFFLSTGLKTSFAFGDASMWTIFSVAMAVCITGKFLGISVPAYLSGQSMPFSITLGTLMQCKGLMEIVVVTLLYSRGVFGPSTFTALVLVALVSTAITAPLSKFAQWYFGEAATQTREEQKVEISVPTVPDLPKAEQPGKVVAQRTKVEGASLDFENAIGKVAVTSPDVVIGRHKEDGVRVNDVRVSRGHARLQKLADGVYEITNLTATRSEPNPITINGEAKDKAILKDGDVVSLNGVKFKFRNAA
jgi:Kef-type K+ transport system membrane component KefB